MPYLNEGRKKELLTEPQRANTDGDYNFLFTQEYLKVFNANPSYATIALIKKASIRPEAIASVDHLERTLMFNGVISIDRIAARELAFLEFYHRVGYIYELRARENNGDLASYQEAFRAINEKFALGV